MIIIVAIFDACCQCERIIEDIDLIWKNNYLSSEKYIAI